MIINHLAHIKHSEYIKNNRAFVSLEADDNAVANLQELEKLLSTKLTEQKF